MADVHDASYDPNTMTMHDEEDDDPDDDDVTNTTINNEDDDENNDIVRHDLHDHYDYQQQHLPHTLSRLSICTSKSDDHSMYDNYYYDDDGYGGGGGGGQDDDMSMYMSLLSMEGSVDGEAENLHGLLSYDDHIGKGQSKGGISLVLLDSDHDNEPGCYSLPVTPPRRIGGSSSNLIDYDIDLQPTDISKEYASENEAEYHQKGGLIVTTISKKKRRNWRRRTIREKWLERVWEKKKTLDDNNDEDEDLVIQQYPNNNTYTSHRFSSTGGHELIGGGGGGGVGDHEHHSLVIMTRPTGGRRSLYMDFEEVKACRDLGFELEHERMMLDYNMNTNNNNNISSRISTNSGGGSCARTMDTASTSTGGNSPIANWRISSPGDDPKDVKARLKVWAQAVALASASNSRLLG